MRDVHVVGQPEPAAVQCGKHNRHFHDLVLTILKGMISWVRQTYPPGAQTLRAAMDLCGLDEAELRVLAGEIDRWKAGPTRFVRDSVRALHRLSGTDEGTSFATTTTWLSASCPRA